MPVVFIPGKGNVSFPDDMDMDTIRWTIANRIIPGVKGGTITEEKGEPTFMGGLRGIGAQIAALPAQAKRLFIEQAEPTLTSLIRYNPFAAGNLLQPEEATRSSVRGLLDALGVPAPPDPVERARQEALFGKTAVRPEYEQEAAEATAAAARMAPQYESALARGAYSAASSLIQTAPGLAASIATRSPIPAYANIAAITAPEAYQRYRDRGGAPEEAALGAGLETGIELATEALPLGFAVKQLGRVGFGKFLRGFLGRELPSEQIATITQSAVDTAIANPDKTWGEYLQELPGQMAETAIATGLTAGTLAGVGKGAQLVAQRLGVEEAPPGLLPGEGEAPPAFTPPTPGTPPSEGLLGALGTPGSTIYIREGDGEAPYIFRGVDDTGRVLIEDGGGNIFAEDPSDLEGTIIRSEPPAAPPPEAPPVEPPFESPLAPPQEPPLAEPPMAEPPSAPPLQPELPLAEPPVMEPPLAAPEPPAVEPPEEKPFTPFQPPDKPVIQDEATRNYWSSNLARQRGQLVRQRDALANEVTALQETAIDLGPEDIDDYRSRQDDLGKRIDAINTEIASVDEDIRGLDEGVAPVPRARPLDDNTAVVADQADEALANAVRDLPATGVMDWFAQNASTDFHREVAKRVGALMNAMENSGFQFNWGVYNPNYQPRDAGEQENYNYVMKRPRVRGAAWTHSKEKPGYRGGGGTFNKVDIGVKDWDQANSGANEVTILHEFAHAVTVAAIAQLRGKRISPNSRVGKAVKELQSLKRAAVTHKNKLLKDIANGKPVDPRLRQALENLESSNAWDNEKELIVQGLSNIDMQIVLKSMPYKKTNGFVEFIREIGRLIGVTEKDMNGLRRLFELTDELIPTSAEAQQDVIQAMMKPLEYGATPAPTPSQDTEPTASKEAPSPRNTETKSRVGDVMFDQRNGIGQVPLNEKVDYYGFTAMMRPSKFLELAASLRGEEKQPSIDYIESQIREGNPVGSPFLNIDFDTGRVAGHEGRHRMMAIQRVNGDAPVPVHMFGRGEQRSRNLNPDKIARFREELKSEGGGISAGNFEEAFLQGNVIPAAAEPTAPSAAELREQEAVGPTTAELVVPEEEARRITDDAATEPDKDTKKEIAEAVEPVISFYNLRYELSEKYRGCG